MQISLSEVGKRYHSSWIFRGVSFQFLAGSAYAITGPNGSGKSTLLQVIAGATEASEGRLEYQLDGKAVDPGSCYRALSIAAPYLELIEEMTLQEFLRFHGKFKPYLPGLDPARIIRIIGLEDSADKQIRFFSSGMKQRVKLAQAICSDTPCVLLDEPCTNFDEEGYRLYDHLIATYGRGRLLIVSSNEKREYAFCRRVLRMTDFHPGHLSSPSGDSQ